MRFVGGVCVCVYRSSVICVKADCGGRRGGGGLSVYIYIVACWVGFGLFCFSKHRQKKGFGLGMHHLAFVVVKCLW